MIVSKQFHLSSRNFRLIACGDLPPQSTTCLCPSKTVFIFWKKSWKGGENKKEKGKSCRPKSSVWWSPNFIHLPLWCSAVGSQFRKKGEGKREGGRERGEDSARSRWLFIPTSPCHWVCERLVHCQGEFFYPWFHMVWTGLHVAQHASANVFSIRCLISRELASDEACWQHNGRENLRRIHQMAALLWHLGQNLVDGELAARLLFPPCFFLLSLPLWQNVPDLTFIKLTFGFFFTLFTGTALHLSHLCVFPL